ncbi:MAG: sugar phosphate isomerase/epimerase [Chloroflexi bacterium]|nr:sugar phosphate isomerase/epimerase [Chloroflexota bacterium]
MKWAINQITLAGGSRRPPDDLPRDLAAIRAGGWRAIEVWLPHWDNTFERLGPAARRLLDDAGLVAAGGCGFGDGGSLFFSRGEARRRAHDSLARRLEQCQALGASHLVVAPGFELPVRPSPGNLETAAESLRTAAETAARHGVRLGVEFLAGARLVSTLPTAAALAERAAHPNVGIVVDTYHLFAGLSKTEDLELVQGKPARLFFVHVSDVDGTKPRDLWRVADRVVPGAGGIPNAMLVERVRAVGYDGDISLELFDAGFEARWQEDASAAARLAYERCIAVVADVPLEACPRPPTVDQ